MIELLIIAVASLIVANEVWIRVYRKRLREEIREIAHKLEHEGE